MYKKFIQLKLTHMLYHVESERNSLDPRIQGVIDYPPLPLCAGRGR